MSNVLRFTTHFVAEQIEPQYAAAMSKAEAYAYESTPDDPDVMLVHGGSIIHRLSTKDWLATVSFLDPCGSCRHAIAYRRHTDVAGPVIPWSCIDERWTIPVSNLQSVRQVQYQAFDLNSSSKIRKKPRAHADRYKEAVRATHLIASELADLADEGEFDEMLGFVLQQWRNVRQKHKKCRLTRDYNTCRFAGFQSVTIKSSRARDPVEGLMSSDVLARVVSHVSDPDVDTVMLPLNFHSAHWCCIVVKVSVQRIYYYDPLNQKGYVRAAKEVATYLKFQGLNNYDVVAQNNPIQFD
ncbi:hypothetical protein PF007_g4960 [Phytophthora fragariae]|uniref:Ubiquitin-like protease family profile domain-containing protein n=2 Tax=Phytophthora fragariae TaxID=53985 RepID=A0A6A3T875_9STRA|nr:hypothetical protein PF007_g4960 [Phytophthora fragariae]